MTFLAQELTTRKKKSMVVFFNAVFLAHMYMYLQGILRSIYISEKLFFGKFLKNHLGVILKLAE